MGEMGACGGAGLGLSYACLRLCSHCRDESENGDAWAVRHGWVSVTPLGLRQDWLVAAPPAPGGRTAGVGRSVVDATVAVIRAAAAELDLAAGGLVDAYPPQPQPRAEVANGKL
jgi:hypothetical protein